MLTIVNLPSGNPIAQFAYRRDAESYLANFETTPPTHEITGEPEPDLNEAE